MGHTVLGTQKCFMKSLFLVVATLKESSGDAITICDPDARVGREFLIEIEFEADPEPEIVTNFSD